MTPPDITALVERLREADAYNRKHYVRDPLHKEAADALEALVKERDEAQPWLLFYRDGKTLGEIAEACGGSVYTYSPWLTRPITRAAVDASGKSYDRALAAEARAERAEKLLGALAMASEHPGEKWLCVKDAAGKIHGISRLDTDCALAAQALSESQEKGG